MIQFHIGAYLKCAGGVKARKYSLKLEKAGVFFAGAVNCLETTDWHLRGVVMKRKLNGKLTDSKAAHARTFPSFDQRSINQRNMIGSHLIFCYEHAIRI